MCPYCFRFPQFFRWRYRLKRFDWTPGIGRKTYSVHWIKLGFGFVSNETITSFLYFLGSSIKIHAATFCRRSETDNQLTRLFEFNVKIMQTSFHLIWCVASYILLNSFCSYKKLLQSWISLNKCYISLIVSSSFRCSVRCIGVKYPYVGSVPNVTGGEKSIGPEEEEIAEQNGRQHFWSKNRK